MRVLRMSGSVRGVHSNGHPYRDPRTSDLRQAIVGHRRRFVRPPSPRTSMAQAVKPASAIGPIWWRQLYQP